MGALDGEQLHGLRLQVEVEGPLALLRSATTVNAELLGRDDAGAAAGSRPSTWQNSPSKVTGSPPPDSARTLCALSQTLDCRFNQSS